MKSIFLTLLFIAGIIHPACADLIRISKAEVVTATIVKNGIL